jgi:hypothetical protein
VAAVSAADRAGTDAYPRSDFNYLRAKRFDRIHQTEQLPRKQNENQSSYEAASCNYLTSPIRQPAQLDSNYKRRHVAFLSKFLVVGLPAPLPLPKAFPRES